MLVGVKMRFLLALLFFCGVAFAQVTDLVLLRSRIEQGDFLSAIPKLEAHVKARPSDSEAYFLLARALYLAGGAVYLSRAEDAINQCFRLSNLPRPESYWQRGLIRAGSNRFKDALLDLRVASSSSTRANPKEVFRYAMDWGATAWRSGDLTQALEAYRRAVRLDSSQALPWLHQGTLLLALNDPKEAEVTLSKAISLMQTPKPHPALAEAFYWRGRALEMQNKLEAAKENYRRALEQNPSHGAARAALEALTSK
jgi:tetratricopeptide (TPR) repeat protein